MNPQKQELIEKLKAANNILVTVSANPSVDQLAACIGMTVLLNKLKKHATAVFSGEVPSTIEFLKPEDTLEKTTDSLRDFIISLDKSKADKLRYKVEDQVVRIFITPYRTSINQEDLEFSQGDFNVDVVLCLGVNQQQDLDQAITSHGRILHDAVIASINTKPGGELGTINWTDPAASSLSELVSGVAEAMGKELLDAQVSTALLTGIVAETARFSNEKTSPETMRLAAELMGAGANQQLVATQLEVPATPPVIAASDTASDVPAETEAPEAVTHDGTLEISHHDTKPVEAEEASPVEDLPATTESAEASAPDAAGDPALDDILKDLQVAPGDGPTPQPVQLGAVETPPEEPSATPASRIMLQPPSLGGTLTANSNPEDEALQDPLTSAQSSDTPGGGDNQLMLDHGATTGMTGGDAPTTQPSPGPDSGQIQIDADGNLQTSGSETLAAATSNASSTEPSSSAIPTLPTPDPTVQVDAARNAVESAIDSAPATGPLPPTAATGAGGYLDVQAPSGLTEAEAYDPLNQPGPSSLPPTPTDTPTPSSSPSADSTAPPPVPPPLPLNDLNNLTPPTQ